MDGGINTEVVRAEVEAVMSPRAPRHLRGMAFALPALCNLVDRMGEAPFRFYAEDCGNLRVRWIAERIIDNAKRLTPAPDAGTLTGEPVQPD